MSFLLSFLVITAVFALLYKYVPDTPVAWWDVWLGAFVTALLFNLGKFLIGQYLGHSATTSSYGAAGALVVLLLWVYFGPDHSAGGRVHPPPAQLGLEPHHLA